MLNISYNLLGFDQFTSHLGRLAVGGLINPGFRLFTEHARQIVIDKNPVGVVGEDPHPGLMKKSWQKPTYTGSGVTMKATVKNTVDYGVAENYGHYQQPGKYIPEINATLVHYWVPGTYALETSLDQAGLDIEAIIRPEVLRAWDSNRTSYYDNPYGELG